ncbi:MAG: 30S ribosome-binding factor RbfA [Firmicutes bacterium]|nr:30S ribosome-binding factor RbfA [Bacillota bacterium]
MGKQRAQRLAELLKKEISDIILKEVKDPRIGFVSLTDVEVSGDLRHANVYVSVYGEEKERNETMQGLKKANSYIRKLLGERIKVYHTPELLFKYDNSIEHGAYISQLIDQVNKEGREESNND